MSSLPYRMSDTLIEPPIDAPTVLLADDEPNIRFALRHILEGEGYRVRETIDGISAIESSLRSKPDLIILDLSMPNLDGMQVLKELQMILQPDPPKIVILTAYASISACMQATDLGATAFLEKPITPERLRNVVATALGKKRRQEPRDCWQHGLDLPNDADRYFG